MAAKGRTQLIDLTTERNLIRTITTGTERKRRKRRKGKITAGAPAVGAENTATAGDIGVGAGLRSDNPEFDKLEVCEAKFEWLFCEKAYYFL